MGFLLINAVQHAATLFDGRKRLIKPHLSTKNERILPANGDPCKSPACVQSFIEAFPLLAGKQFLSERFHLSKTVAVRRAASLK